jgi:ribonucleoside-triphosphate reductase
MSIKALQSYTFHSKYARYNSDLKRRDTWFESNDRVLNMHLSRYPQIAEELNWAFEQAKAKRVLGSQRALQYAGEPVLRKHARVYNCTVSYCDRMRFFQEALWLLLCGSGVGFSVQTHHIAKLPDFLPTRSLGGSFPSDTVEFYIPDNIEGWADALGVLLATYFPHPDYPEWAGKTVKFNYSLIRLKGSKLSSGVGKAPGPEPLMKSLEAIRELLERCLADGQHRLRSIDAYDVVMHASDAVLSGGVRRSATICIFSPDDELMAKAKIGDWYYTNPQRGRSNNSAMLVRDTTTPEMFNKLMTLVRQFGEPGFVWSDSTEMMFNPCVEIGMYPVDVTTGKSGWAFCNLCEINGKKCKTKEDFAIAARAAAIIGTAQAGYTDFEYLGQTTKNIADREALLGVSITGMMDSPDILFDPETQREMAQLVVETNKEIAARIGIRQAARCTCVKPAGTTSCILGTSSGIHAHHSKRYIRRVQANMLEAPYQFLAEKNPRAVEKSVWSKNGTDSVISFCIETAEGARTRKDMTAIKLLEHVRLTQNNWVEAGRNAELCTQPYLRHNVSNTINVRPDEWDAVEAYIYEHRQDFAGVSLLSSTGDLDYPQAPFTAIHTPAEIVKMYGDGSLMASGLIVDGLSAFDNNLWLACDYATGVNKLDCPEAVAVVDENGNELPPTEVEMAEREEVFKCAVKRDWIRRAHQFSERYFGGDLKLMSYCLKEVHNWKYWCDLQREYVDVDYKELLEDEDNTKIQDTAACAGGVCELVF